MDESEPAGGVSTGAAGPAAGVALCGEEAATWVDETGAD
jgi:hypothetical protein